MMPVQADFDREAWLGVLVQAPDTRGIEAFLETRILRFVQDYLRVRDPESPWQIVEKRVPS